MIHIVGVDELDPRHRATWSTLQEASPLLRSPFYRPEFVESVQAAYRAAGTGDRVEVAIIGGGTGPVVGVWPFEREGARLAVPAGRFLNDFQGIISAPGLALDPIDLLAAAGLDRWRFDHVPPDQPGFGPFVRTAVMSPQIDTSSGWEQLRLGLPALRRLDPAVRRLERDLGPVRVEVAHDRSALDTLMRWKSRQYVEAGKRDVFALGWCRELAGILVASTRPELRGHLTTLWAGDRMLAAHLGLQSAGTLHYWLPAYDRAFSRYSPGTVLLLHLVRDAPSHGIDLIDLGKGREPYKERLANRGELVGHGVVERPTPSLRLRRGARWARSVIRGLRAGVRRR